MSDYKTLQIADENQPQEDAYFQINTIQLFAFQFLKHKISNQDEINRTSGIQVEAKKRKDQNGEVDIITKINVDFQYAETRMISCEAVFIASISVSEKFDERFLNNVVAIIYSYLRPIVAQMTIMAKTQPLDLPPLSFENITIKEWDEEY